ncbi:PD-(D/E)XK nuclease family protein [Paracidovorax oryzae]|uniref:PDDEXK-like family protein n=1 Tax=Paracidovorax oryzae TaxID=862720 RepID=UPI00030812C9|nr:PD-(D/E)XK nuclease family protein [Paracidovorax oryzae]
MREEGPTKAQASALLGDVQARYQGWQHAQKLMAPLLATDFSPFDAQRNREIDISRHLALLLDPEGTHGQGRLFWDGFAALVLQQQNALHRPSEQQGSTACGEAPPSHDPQAAHTPVATTWLAASPVKQVQREHCTQSGRFIDLYVQLRSGCIGIENKPWRHSRDGAQQLTDYATHLQRHAEKSGPQCPWMLIYLGHQAPDPSSLPEKKREELIRSGHFVYLLWPEVLDWLRASLPRIQAQKVRWFVEELCNYLQRHIGSDLPEAAMNHIAEAFTATPQALASAFQMRSSLADWQKQQLARLRKQLEAAATGTTVHWEGSDNLLKASKSIAFSLELGWGPDLLLSFEWWNPAEAPDDFYWGIYLSPEQVKQAPQTLMDAIRRHATQKLGFPSEEPEESWPYWTYVCSDPLFVPADQTDVYGSGVRHPWLTLGEQPGNFVSLVMQRHQEVIDLLKHPAFDELHRLVVGAERTRP